MAGAAEAATPTTAGAAATSPMAGMKGVSRTQYSRAARVAGVTAPAANSRARPEQKPWAATSRTTRVAATAASDAAKSLLHVGFGRPREAPSITPARRPAPTLSATGPVPGRPGVDGLTGCV